MCSPKKLLHVSGCSLSPLCCLSQRGHSLSHRQAHLSHCPVEVVGFPKVGQVNFSMRADLLVTMDIAQLHTNNPPQRTSLLLLSFPPLFSFKIPRNGSGCVKGMERERESKDG